MEEEFKVKGKSGVSIEDFASWWYGKRKNVQAIPAEAAQEVKDKYWTGGEWTETIETAVNGVFGNLDGQRDSRNMNSHERLAWACAEIGLLKRLMASEMTRRDSDTGLVEPLTTSGKRHGASNLDVLGGGAVQREEQILTGQKEILELLHNMSSTHSPRAGGQR
jgi:hypothetical protein